MRTPCKFTPRPLLHLNIMYANSRQGDRVPSKWNLNRHTMQSLNLNNAKFLKEDKYYTGVNVSKWLSREELNNLKRLRQQYID